ncbi:unnamed protein product [Auanema sp. JU1783]|nr:unnamed protein product [Auanema sp. JU1783]
MKFLNLLFLVINLLLVTSAWKINDVERKVDISTQIVKVTSVVTFENDNADANSLFVLLTSEEEDHLAFLEVNEDGKRGKLKVSADASASKEGFKAYKVDLSAKVAKGKTIKLKVDYRLIEALVPFPAKIAQSDSQFVQYHGSAHYAAAYPVQKEKTTIKLASGKALSVTSVNPSKQEGDVVTYGPYASQPAYNKKPITVHYENNYPFVVATLVERSIEISHWGGNIAVEDYIELVHKGAELKGSFSRLEFQMDRRGKRQPALQRFLTVLPGTAKDIYYRDEIGNISTSGVRLRADSVEVDVRPRYPLFGGWKTSYVIGYNLPSSEYLYHKGNNYALKMKVFDHIFDNIAVEKLTTKVILPELAAKVKVSTPYSMDRKPDELRATYLDTVGRTVVVLQKESLVDDHIQSFTLTYEFDSVSLLREPLMASVFFFCLFIVVIIYVRLDFTIVADPEKDIKEKIRGIVSVLDSLIDKKQHLYTVFINDTNEFKSTGDEEILKNAKKALDTNRNSVNGQIQSTLNSLKALSESTYEKATDLLRYDKIVLDNVDGYLSVLVKSQQKSGVEDVVLKKVSDARIRADAILSSL